MKEARVRLLFHPKLREHERIVALGAAREFGKKFDVICDCASLDQTWALWGVLYGSAISYVLRKTDLDPKDLLLKNIRECIDIRNAGQEFGFGINKFGLGIAPNGLLTKGDARMRIDDYDVMGVRFSDQMKPLPLIELLSKKKAYGDCYVDKDKTPDIALAASMRLTLGKMFHNMSLYPCPDGNCIMQPTTDYPAFVEKIAKQRLDFCAGCSEVIRMRVLARMVGTPAVLGA